MIVYFSAANTETQKRISRHLADWTEGRDIESADVLVAEASDSSAFSVGYEVAQALQRKKPVLILVKQGAAPASYAAGLKDELLTCQEYTDETLGKLVESFLKDNELAIKDLRFNFVIDRQIYNHLRLKSFKSGKTKAEVVRDLLIKDLEDGSD